MKKIFLLCLLLGVFCFSSDGFKEVKWGASQKSVIEYLGPNYKIDKTNILIYENVPFANFNLSKSSFKVGHLCLLIILLNSSSKRG